MSNWLKKIGDRTRGALNTPKKPGEAPEAEPDAVQPVDPSGLDFGEPVAGASAAKPGGMIAQLAGLNPNESARIDSGYDPDQGPRNLLREIEDSMDIASGGMIDALSQAADDPSDQGLIARHLEQDVPASPQEAAAAGDDAVPDDEKTVRMEASGYRDVNLEFDDEFGALESGKSSQAASVTPPPTAEPVDSEDSIERSLSTVKLDIEDLDLGAFPAPEPSTGAPDPEPDALSADAAEDSIERSLSTVKLDVADLDLGPVPDPGHAAGPVGEPSAESRGQTPAIVGAAASPSAGAVDASTAPEIEVPSVPSPANPLPGKAAAQPEEPDDDATQVGLSPAVSQDAVTGWLVVVEGPGKGISRPLGVGINSVGRAPDNRVPLYLGGKSDGEISRRDHVRVIYDPKSNTFNVQHGSSRNLSYLNDNPIYETTPLKARDRITVGKTVLAFMPFCDQEFSW